MPYDDQNIFARILRGEIPCNKILDTAHALAFHDIKPERKVHALVIPKGSYVSFEDFTENASAEEQLGFYQAVREVAGLLELRDSGYRLISNHGANSGQEVPHFHMHLLGGEPVGRLVA